MPKTPLHKNQELTLSVERYGLDAMGVCHHEGRVFFVPGAIPGETVRARVTRVEKRHAFARVAQVLVPSPRRAEPPCPLFPRCGGCVAQHMDYGETLAYKRQQVADCLGRTGGISLPVAKVLAAEHPFHYRNKASYPIGGTAEEPQIGFYAPRSHRMVPLTSPCLLQRPGSDEALRILWDWMRAFRVAPYEEAGHTGLPRHLVTRTNRAGEGLLILVSRQEDIPHLEALLESWSAGVPGLKSVYLCVQPDRGNQILGPDLRLLWGESTLTETQMGLSFRLSPLSFFQVHPEQAERLYEIALSLADLRPESRVVDAYCGAGSITLPLARRVREAVGLEIVPEAVADAKYNAEQNGIRNASFVTGPVEETLPRLLGQGFAPDALLLDPPRKGCEPQVLSAIGASRVPRVVYVSCNPATLARDAAALVAGGYEAEAARPVDMFCWTGAVETVLSFRRREEAE